MFDREGSGVAVEPRSSKGSDILAEAAALLSAEASDASLVSASQAEARAQEERAFAVYDGAADSLSISRDPLEIEIDADASSGGTESAGGDAVVSVGTVAARGTLNIGPSALDAGKAPLEAEETAEAPRASSSPIRVSAGGSGTHGVVAGQRASAESNKLAMSPAAQVRPSAGKGDGGVSSFTEMSASAEQSAPPESGGADFEDDDPDQAELLPYSECGPFVYRWDWGWQEMLRALARNKWFNMISSLALVFALFASDMLLVTTAPPASIEGIEWSLFVVFVWFWLELFMITSIERQYLFSFYFWMDLVGTLSIVFDISWMSEGIYEALGMETSGQATVLRATRAARIGGRAGRLMRLVRIVRMLKFFRLRRVLKGEADHKAAMVGKDAPSNIAKALSENISRQVATLVLLSVFVPMFLSADVVDESMFAYVNTFEAVTIGNPNTYTDGTDRATLQPLVDAFRRDFGGVYDDGDGLPFGHDDDYACSGCGGKQRPIFLQIGQEVWAEDYFGRGTPADNYLLAVDGLNDCLAEGSAAWREAQATSLTAPAPIESYASAEGPPCVIIRFDVSAAQAEEGVYNIALVVFVVVLLVSFSFVLNATSNRLVVRPIERIFRSIQMNAAQVMNSLALGHDGMEMKDMEAVVGKMTKVEIKTPLPRLRRRAFRLPLCIFWRYLHRSPSR